MTDYRIARRDAALAKANQLEHLASQGGNALYDTSGLMKQAAAVRKFAKWVDDKIVAHPFL